LFVWELLEHLRQVSDPEDFFYLGGEPNNFHRAALLYNRDVDTCEFADAGAVEIAELAEIEKYVVAFFVQQNFYGVMQRGDFQICKMADNVNERDVATLADLYRKIHDGQPFESCTAIIPASDDKVVTAKHRSRDELLA